jgi:hypothetical protein
MSGYWICYAASRHNSRSIRHLTEEGQLMAVPVKETVDFEAGLPTALFETNTAAPYAVTADGQRFLIPTDVAPSAPRTVVSNWAAELKR